MGFVRTIWEQAVVTLILTVFLAGTAFLINRYYGSDFESHYDIQDIKLPLSLSSPKLEKSRVLTLVLNNRTNTTVNIKSIKVFGLARFDGVRLLDFTEDEHSRHDKIETQMSEGGVLTITKISPFAPARVRAVYVWGTFLTDSVVITTDRGIYVADDAIRASGIEKLFAKNWKLNALIIAFVAFLSFYFGKLRKS